MNSVKLYSNGTAVICKEYSFTDLNPLRISIPVRKTDLDDVVSSLTVFGDVVISSPPTYTPTNALETALTLDPTDVLKDLTVKMAGASVEIEAGANYSGKLVGRRNYRRELNGTVIEYSNLILQTQRGFQQIEESAVTAMRFTDRAVQAEVDKALRASLNRIKPDSSQIELTIQPNEGATNAFVVYATPVAAWKIRYQLRLSATGAELEGQAIIDNDTDDDWIDTMVTVVTGEPITFSTDLAEIRRPTRDRVNIVSARATGAVIAESVEVGAVLCESAEGDDTDYDSGLCSINRSNPQKAEQSQAEVRESGDFSIFASPNPVTVGTKQSAIIPLFRSDVGECPVILFYRSEDNSERPFRAVRLRNKLEHSLGRGVCEVFLDGEFQGKCVLEPTKSNEEALLIYAKETGVRVTRDFRSSPELNRSRINISDGKICLEDMLRWRTVFEIVNSRKEAFPLEIEHSRELHDSKVEIRVSSGECEVLEMPDRHRIRGNLVESIT